jgi:hypothetical protein
MPQIRSLSDTASEPNTPLTRAAASSEQKRFASSSHMRVEDSIDGSMLLRHAQDQAARVWVDVGPVTALQDGLPGPPQEILLVEDEDGLTSCTSAPRGHGGSSSGVRREHAAEHDIDPGDGQPRHVTQS